MTLSKLWTDFSLKLHTLTAQAAGAVYVDGIRDQSISSGLQTRVEGADGSLYNTFGSLVSGAPTGQVNTTDLKQFLDEVSVNTGMLIDADGTHPGVVMYFQRMADGGTRDAAGAGTHISATFENGIVVPTALQASHLEPATLSLTILPKQSGAVAPVTFNEADNLDVVSPSVDDIWTLGPVDLNAVTVDGLQSVNVDFGIDAQGEQRDSDIYPSFVSIRRVQPTITLSGVHADILSELTEDGKFYAASTVRIFLRKRAEGGTFELDATVAHMLLTLGKCRVDWDTVTGDPKTINLTLTPWHDTAPVTPITMSTAIAIT